MKIDEIEVYQAYIRAKADPNKTVTDVANEFKITRGYVYDIKRRIENGDVAKLRRCTEDAKLDCLWLYKYKIRYEALPKDRTASTVEALRVLIKEMIGDEFPQSKVAQLLKKERSTIIYHLNA